LTTDLSGKVVFDNLEIKEGEQKDYISRITKNHGLIWIISGQVYNIPDFAELTIKDGALVKKGETLATIKFSNHFNGYVQIQEKDSDYSSTIKKDIYVIHESIIYENLELIEQIENKERVNLLVLNREKKFRLNVKTSDFILDYQSIATLITENYTTKTGGIIKFLNLPTSKKKVGPHKNSYEILGPGYILWIAEETHTINKESNLVLVKDGEYIEAGTEISKNTFCKVSGVVELIKKDDVIKEIIIKPGKLYPCKTIGNSHVTNDKKRGFLRPGEKLYNQLTTEKLVYWERM
jgi:DNA-directed RNA polymerase subunit beta'